MKLIEKQSNEKFNSTKKKCAPSRVRWEGPLKKEECRVWIPAPWAEGEVSEPWHKKTTSSKDARAASWDETLEREEGSEEGKKWRRRIERGVLLLVVLACVSWREVEREREGYDFRTMKINALGNQIYAKFHALTFFCTRPFCSHFFLLCITKKLLLIVQ